MRLDKSHEKVLQTMQTTGAVDLYSNLNFPMELPIKTMNEMDTMEHFLLVNANVGPAVSEN